MCPVMQNHCCAPSLYIKVLEVDGRGRLLFFARNDIVVGQVLDERCASFPNEMPHEMPRALVDVCALLGAQSIGELTWGCWA